MKTAKDLAFKAYRAHIKEYENEPTTETKNSFEHWWNSQYNDNKQADWFRPELSVFIDGKRYIQAE